MTGDLPGAVAPPPARVKCLLVDDRPENLLALSALLEGPGVELLQAGSGREALELLLRHDVALAFLDVQMPEMDGFELAELMRGSERTRHVPLIFVTAAAHDRHRLFKGYETGAVDFIFKPIEPHVLQSKADVFFQLHRQKLQLAQQLQERTETLRLNELFNAVLGHDLRNPLSAILMSAHLLKRRSQDEGVQQIADRLLTSGKWMSRMIADMLDLARARLGGGFPVARRPMDLATLMPRLVQEQQTTFPQARIALQVRGDLRGEWDPDRLTQVVANLVGNAVQHGLPEHPIDIDVDGTHGDTVTLRVANDGSIPAALLPHIFDPFRGGKRAASRTDGLGLGLYIVQQIAEAHGGRIAVHSAEGERTRFDFSVPRGAHERPLSPAAEPPRA